MVRLAEVLSDLRDESAALDRLVSRLSDVDWSRPTPAVGWTVAHQIAHLAWTDRAATLAATDRFEFFRILGDIMDEEPGTFTDRAAAEGVAPPPELLQRWRDGREALAKALTAVPPGEQIAWFGTAMSATSSATARLMETWAHGQDVADTFAGEPGELGEEARRLKEPTARLRHIGHLGYRTIGHSFTSHGRPLPSVPFRVELAGPDGAFWTFGPQDAEQRITGPALDFALLVTQRRHHTDLALQTTGDLAREWLSVAQAFAGPPGAGREPGAAAGREPDVR
jgi:uncharacterized protein (TIGR03084 family)